jgi:formate dehydrogenase subunit delta
MSPEKMVHMANQIAAFFKSQPGTDAAKEVAGHLADFWEPRMRAQYLAYVAEGGKGLDPVAIAAAGLMKPVVA